MAREGHKSRKDYLKAERRAAGECQAAKLNNRIQAEEEWREEETRAVNVGHGTDKGGDTMEGLCAFVERLFTVMDAAKEDFDAIFPSEHKEEPRMSDKPRATAKIQAMIQAAETWREEKQKDKIQSAKTQAEGEWREDKPVIDVDRTAHGHKGEYRATDALVFRAYQGSV